eukprot:TRINITY_DN2742_c0_g3_i3.p1 TRINITY_DN2742_c0_g3~~TRINITY_DN2742_c0_g3_i3.p1  ORF type:complete len:381 (+),score=97.99 TRINITY_DN2742_c0_g3_i3:952-2094(+)
MISALQSNYNSRLGKMYLLNVSFGVMFIWKIVSAFVNPVTRSKIKVFSTNKPQELLDDIHPSQLPRAYGGEYDPPEKAWPPAFPPQTYRDEYETMHFTPEEFRAELLRNKEAVPSPEIAREMKGSLRGKRVPPKTYYLRNGVNQKRDQLNCIIEPAAKEIEQRKARQEERKHVGTNPVISKAVDDKVDGIIEEKDDAKKITQNNTRAVETKVNDPPAANSLSQRENQEQDKRQESDCRQLMDLKDETREIKIEFAPPLKSETAREQYSERANRLVEEAKESAVLKESNSVTDGQAGNSTSLSARQEIQPHNFDKAKENEKVKYKKTKACCECRMLCNLFAIHIINHNSSSHTLYHLRGFGVLGFWAVSYTHLTLPTNREV